MAEKDKYMISLICEIYSQNKDDKTETDSDTENHLVVTRGVSWGLGEIFEVD